MCNQLHQLPYIALCSFPANADTDPVPYHIEHFADSLPMRPSDAKEAEYLQQWKRAHEEPLLLTNNSTIVDKGGKILVWVLPNAFSSSFQVRRTYPLDSVSEPQHTGGGTPSY